MYHMKAKFDKVPSRTQAEMLSTFELDYLVNSSPKLRTLFLPLLTEHKLLHHVVRSDHNAVRALLTKGMGLLFKRKPIIDCSGRIFESISPFEYALWALDKHMWDTMLSCIPQDETGNKVLRLLQTQY